MNLNIPKSAEPRVVILGAGFAGLALARKLAKQNFQVVLIDRNNYHQFQPLFYQVAMAGLEPSSIVFPIRKAFQNSKNVFIRVTEATAIDAEKQVVETPLGVLEYDFLVIAIGCTTNFFGNKKVEQNAIPMKSVSEALFLRNQIFEDYEKAVITENEPERQAFLDIVIVGGGATGVEVAGALAEMKRHILPKDYPDFEAKEVEIHLVHGNSRLLNTMSEKASAKAERYLRDLDVTLWLDKTVKDFDGETAFIDDGSEIKTRKVIWAAGIVGNSVLGVPAEAIGRGKRLLTDRANAVVGLQNVFAIGDIASVQGDEKWPNGHPQVAQVAIQQAVHLAKNLQKMQKGQPAEPFSYRDLGSMATVGRHKAVADIPNNLHFGGALAWFAWLFVHLFAIAGMKNKVFIFLNWVWNYLTYDQSLRLVIKPRQRPSA